MQTVTVWIKDSWSGDWKRHRIKARGVGDAAELLAADLRAVGGIEHEHRAAHRDEDAAAKKRDAEDFFDHLGNLGSPQSIAVLDADSRQKVLRVEREDRIALNGKVLKIASGLGILPIDAIVDLAGRGRSDDVTLFHLRLDGGIDGKRPAAAI